MESLRELYKIGPGPSSSHTMGPKKCAEYVLEKHNSDCKIKVVLYQSLALTGKGHLTDYIIKKVLPECEVKFDIFTEVPHPNTLDFYVYDLNGELIKSYRFFSVGGGSILLEGEKEEEKINVFPHKNFTEIKKYCIENNLNLAEYVYSFDKDIKSYLEIVYNKMKSCVENGLQKEGLLPGSLKVERRSKQLHKPIHIFESDNIRENRLVSCYAFAVSEENASGHEIVTAPTCGASGVLPAVLYYLEEKYKFSKDKILDGLAVAGIIGNVVKRNASISGAECGCQAEVGTATSMAAAFHAFMFDYTIDQIEYASEVALEHQLGLTCDPIRGYVQIPCIERNAVAATRAIASSNLAYFLTGSRKISFDYVVKTMKETGKDLHSHYRETSLGGLAKDYNNE